MRLILRKVLYVTRWNIATTAYYERVLAFRDEETMQAVLVPSEIQDGR